MANRIKLILGMIAFFGLFCTADAFATDYSRTSSGASWYYYSFAGNKTYSEDEMLYVPFSEVSTEKVAIPAKTCQSYGGFWVLLRNGYENGKITGKPISATVLSEVYYKDMTWNATGYTAFKEPSAHTTSPDDSNNDGVSATAFGDMGTVLNAYRALARLGTSAISQAAKDNIGNLSYFCAGSDPADIPNVTADFVSFSTVSLNDNYTSAPVVNGQSYISTPMVFNDEQETISVTFHHYFAKNIAHPLDGDTTVSYSLGDGGSGEVQTGANSMSERFDINGVNYYAVSVEKEVALDISSGGDVTYCQSITFDKASYNLADYKVLNTGNTAASSSVCITIQVVTVSSAVVSSCDQGGNGEMFVDKNGNSVAGNSVLGSTIATVGISKNGVLSTTTAATQDEVKEVYTKPGDQVQFSYALCFGAHNVSGASTEPDSAGGRNSNPHPNVFEISVGTEGKTSIEDNQYLFGRADGFLGQTVYVWPKHIKIGDIGEGSFYYGGSPETLVSRDYLDYITIDNTRKQISFASPDDKAGSATYAPVIVGGTLSQTLTYQDLAVWPMSLSRHDGETRQYNDSERPYGWGHIRQQGEIEDYLKAYKDYQEGFTSPSKAKYYLFSEDEIQKTASAVTPYNFDTNVTSEIEGYSSGAVQPGDPIHVKANIDILPRINPLTSDKNENDEFVPYATATPGDTRVEVIELVIRDTAKFNSDEPYTYSEKDITHTATLKEILNGETKDKFTNNMICNMYRYYLGSDLGECSSTIVKGNNKAVKDEELKVVGNKDSNPAGEMGYFNTENEKEKITRVVPDVEAGYKYCIAIGINHGDSHNLPGKNLADEAYSSQAANAYSVSANTSASVKTTWKTSKFSCRTITKKPNFQVWNSGIYADGGISATISDKAVNTKIRSNLPRDDVDTAHRATPVSAFGSWAEYFIVSKSSITGMASASALGYRSPFIWYETDKNGNTVEHREYFAANGFGTRAVDYCDLSRLTIANTACKNNSAGEYATSDTDNGILASIKERVSNYFIDDRSSLVRDKFSSIEDSDYGEKINGASLLKITGPFEIDSQIARPYGSGTLVIEVAGRLTIKENVCIGEGICQDNSNDWENGYAKNINNLSLSSRNSKQISSSNDFSSIPQVILIAEDIDIDANVSQIDAWLITYSDKKEYDGGTINTCANFKVRESGANSCWKTLKINGPVFTSNLVLNRTGGAWTGFAGDVGNHAYDILYKEMEEKVSQLVNNASDPNNLNDPIRQKAIQFCSGSIVYEACLKARIKIYAEEEFLNGRSDAEKKAYKNSGNFSAEKRTISVNGAVSRDLTCDGSITPAEIFDLHPIVYYWALAESQKAHQAIVTYAQEFAPRY